MRFSLALLTIVCLNGISAIIDNSDVVNMHPNNGMKMVTVPMVSDVDLFMQQHGCINNETGTKVFFKYFFLHILYFFYIFSDK